MIAELRQEFNARYTEAKYRELVKRMEARTRCALQIRIAETPVFLPASLTQKMVDAGAAMTRQMLGDGAYLAQAAATIPPAFRVAHQDAHPNFMTVDFGLVHTGDGPWDGRVETLEPRLVEMQAFPSVYGYQAVLNEEYREAFGLEAGLESFLSGMDDREYWTVMRTVICGEYAAENVVLMEVTPELQKTLPDFHIHEDRLGIRAVDVRAIRQRGRRLFYDRDGVETPIARIYNRAIAEEMARKGVVPGFDLCGEVEVEWAGHPHWYFLLSKFSLPFLRHPFVPGAVFLDAWMRGEGRERLPEDRSRWVLKPLFSFAGSGITFGPEEALLRRIPEAERGHYLLQERMQFEPTVLTPFGMTQAEVRILYLWPAGGEMRAVNTLVRLGRGLMMGVDHNRDQRWVGGSSGLVVPGR